MRAWIDTAIMAAMPEEIGPLCARLRFRRRIAIAGTDRAWFGALGDRTHVVVVSGEGGARARGALLGLLDRFWVRRLLIVGVAGALSDDLRAGRLVIAEQVLATDLSALSPQVSLYQRALAVTGATPVIALTTNELLLDRGPRRDLLRLMPRRRAAIVDLESSVHARIADRAQIPWLVLRAVSDEAHERLPTFFAHCRREDGSLARSRILAHALWRPGAWLSLSRLAARTRSCARTIADAVESIASSDGADR